MFTKILIANRGEIACRILRTCRKMGIQTVAVYSDVDQKALHVRMADEAYLLGGPSPEESYLNIPKIIEVAQLSAAEAIHPGYGFLSENSAFARACQEADIRFIGPSPEVMEKMGDKLLARKLAKKAGLPVLRGSDKEVSDAQAMKRAKRLKFPLMVKAAEGGGGIGIDVVHSPDELKAIIEKDRNLAAHAFGSRRLYFEQYLPDASHIEVQVLGDENGNLVHLFERDCSVQRRNQKLVEESPSMKLAPKQRNRIVNYALKLAKHIGYTNAGTVEFLVSEDGEIFFLEMNTRLQVEHGVTEMITGLDLIELQLRVAAGEQLPIKQKSIRMHGHAIEARIYPEDPVTFLPCTGTVHQLHEPTGEHVRVDSALYPGYEVSIHYDPLMAKLLCWGETREAARKGLYKSLREFHIEGVQSNVSTLRSILTYPIFILGKHNTRFLSIVSASQEEAEIPVSGEREQKELAAAIGVSLLLSTNGNGSPLSTHKDQSISPWKLYGRREQMLSRVQGSRGWR